MANYIDISSWNKQVHVHTTGTRQKYILISPDDDKYYFKTSLKKGIKDWKYEFWSEVIASEVGNWLGFNVLKYDVASFDDLIGCISKSIINEDQEEHHDGFRYIIEKFPEFSFNFKKTHSYQKIIGTLKHIDLYHFKKDVIGMIIFDSMIGNTDRHSENWALITVKSEEIKKLTEILESIDKSNLFVKFYFNFFLFFKLRLTNKSLKRLIHKKRYLFSPIYDSGSSLGRELDEEKINILMRDEKEFKNYTDKCYPDIKWETDTGINKLTDFELIETIRLDEYEIVDSIIQRIKKRYSKHKLIAIVNNIDINVPDKFNDYKIPESRKQFIINCIDTKINNLFVIK